MKHILFIIAIILLFFMIYNLSQSIFSLWQKQDLLINARKELEQEKKMNNTLKKQAKDVKDPAFIEKQARDKLLYVKPGEKMVVFSDRLIVKEKKIEAPKEQLPYWQQWWELLVK